MLDCFQSKFGTYPFIEDGYKLVETPYLGMEHQSAVAYGNKYKKGYMGYDLSGTGAGLFLITLPFTKQVMNGLVIALPVKTLQTCGFMKGLLPIPKPYLLNVSKAMMKL